MTKTCRDVARRLTGAAAVLAACVATAAPARAYEKIVFATDWRAEAEHGGFYQALARDFYRKHGLDVTIRQGGPGIDNQLLLATGAVDLALGSNDAYPLNLVQAGAHVRAVMAVFQKDPLALITHPRPDVTSLADMRGKPIMVSDAGISTFWPWLRAKYGFEDSQIRKYTFNMAPFLVDKNAIQQGYVSAEPYLLRKEGVTPKVFLLADDGYPSYAELVIASQALIDAKPQVVQAFVDATIEGWQDYLHGDPSPGNALIKAANPDETDDVIAFGIAEMKAYGLVEGGDGANGYIGAMRDTRWRDYAQLMMRQKMFPANLDWQSAYTLAFLPK